MWSRIIRLLSVMCSALLIAPVLALGQTSARVEYGTIQDLQVYRSSDNRPIDVGTVIGGVAGGVIGHQIGSGRGRTAATIVGTIGGAAVGHEVQEKVSGTRYRIMVRLDSGTMLVVEDARDVNLRVGDRVRVEDNRVSRV